MLRKAVHGWSVAHRGEVVVDGDCALTEVERGEEGAVP